MTLTSCQQSWFPGDPSTFWTALHTGILLSASAGHELKNKDKINILCLCVVWEEDWESRPTWVEGGDKEEREGVGRGCVSGCCQNDFKNILGNGLMYPSRTIGYRKWCVGRDGQRKIATRLQNFTKIMCSKPHKAAWNIKLGNSGVKYVSTWR